MQMRFTWLKEKSPRIGALEANILVGIASQPYFYLKRNIPGSKLRHILALNLRALYEPEFTPGVEERASE